MRAVLDAFSRTILMNINRITILRVLMAVLTARQLQRSKYDAKQT
jgi:hypothetical protein